MDNIFIFNCVLIFAGFVFGIFVVWVIRVGRPIKKEKLNAETFYSKTILDRVILSGEKLENAHQRLCEDQNMLLEYLNLEFVSPERKIVAKKVNNAI